MVWIEINEGEQKLIWIDGYAPEYEYIFKKAKEIDGIFDNADQIERNELFKEILSFTRMKLFENQLGEDKNKLNNFDTYFFTLKQITNELYITDILWDELQEGSKLGKNYSHMIFTVEWKDYNEGLEEKVRGIYRDVIKDFDFKIREESTYKNLTLFEESCKKILFHMGGIYMVPGLMCEKILEKLGFSSDSYGNF